jgi:hypothetical protein
MEPGMNGNSHLDHENYTYERDPHFSPFGIQLGRETFSTILFPSLIRPAPGTFPCDAEASQCIPAPNGGIESHQG